MYTYAFLIFWTLAVACASHAAFVAALFSHAYVWVHYLRTERPDMRLIYGSDTDERETTDCASRASGNLTRGDAATAVGREDLASFGPSVTLAGGPQGQKRLSESPASVASIGRAPHS